MNSNKVGMYVSIAWVTSLAVAFAIGWWTGVKNTAAVATGAARAGFPVLLFLGIIVAAIVAVGAFKTRGLLDRKST